MAEGDEADITKYDMLLQMVNVHNFDARIYQHVIKWQKVMRLI
jgi:hypothetical protein